MTSQGIYYLIRALVALVAIPFHECGHALAAWLLGDDTAKRQGRLSLNPFAHFDLLGTLCMVFAGVGWAKPVSTDPRNFKNPKWGMALTALAGPAANILLAYVGMVVWKLMYYWAPVNDAAIYIAMFLQYLGADEREPGGVQLYPGAAAGRQPHPAGAAAPAHLLWPDEVRALYHDRPAGGGVGRAGCAAVLPEQHWWVALLGKGTGYIDKIAYSIYYAGLGTVV